MSDKDDDIPGLSEAHAARAEFEATATGFDRQVKRALVLWAIRWTIGFALIWAVTSWTGGYAFLWTVGGVVALLSLVVTLGTKFFLARKFATVSGRMDDLETMLREDPEQGRDR